MITPQTNTSLEEIAELLRGLDDFVICGHVSPDGDCLGSQLALYHALRAMGKRAVCLLARDEPVDKTLCFLPGIEDMVPASEYDGVAKVFVACDVPTCDRMGEAAAAFHAAAEITFTIDHHAMENSISDYNYIDPDIASSTMLIWELIANLEVSPSLSMALCAYTGLVTDTGSFQFQNTDAAAFCVASEMISIGIDPSEVARNVFQNRRLQSLRLEQILLSRMVINEENGYVVSYLTLDDFRQLDAMKSDAESLINTLRMLEGIQVACVLRENETSIRGSLRSKDKTDVAEIARSFGGGGHKAAAGFTLYTSLDDAIDQVTAALDAVALREH